MLQALSNFKTNLALSKVDNCEMANLKADTGNGWLSVGWIGNGTNYLATCWRNERQLWEWKSQRSCE